MSGVVLVHMDCTARESLGTNFLVESGSSKQTPSYLNINAETDFSKFKEPRPFELN